jgi:hypothetical protein
MKSPCHTAINRSFPRFNMFGMAVLTAAICLCQQARATTLSDLVEFSANASGGASSGNIWNTRGGDQYVDVFVTDGGGLSSPFINGPDDAHAGISISLSPGLHTYGLFAGSGATNPIYHSLSLFFNGSSTPGISVFAPNQTSISAPSFQANGSSQTLSPTGATVTGANSLSFLDGNTLVSLTSYSWAVPSVYNVDRISAPFGSYGSIGQDGVPDWVGQFTLNVTTVPEPSTGILLGTAIIGVMFSVRRRK